MYSFSNIDFRAQQQFEKALGRAVRRRLLGIGRNVNLTAFEDAYNVLDSQNRSARGLQTIPVEKIAGTVGNNQGFDDQFNPRHFTSQDRWVRLYIGRLQDDPIPPIEVYRVGGSYFVVDGHHRISVARALKQPLIEAVVTEVDPVYPAAC